MNQNKIKVLVVEPLKAPKMVEIADELKSMQEIVGGRIEEIMPFDEEVALICNEEGKVDNLPLNRAIYNEDGEMIDIVTGSFFICSAPFESENFQSLTPEQQKKYTDKFKYPEKFFKIADGIKAVQIKPINKDYER